MSVFKKIRILSDNTELEFVGVVKPTKNTVAYNQYKYVKSKSKMGMLLGLTDTQLESMIRNNIAKEI